MFEGFLENVLFLVVFRIVYVAAAVRIRKESEFRCDANGLLGLLLSSSMKESESFVLGYLNSKS